MRTASRCRATNRYLLRFPPGGLPPAKAFWSVTMYDDKHFLAANPIGRYALGDRDPIRAEPDGRWRSSSSPTIPDQSGDRTGFPRRPVGST